MRHSIATVCLSGDLAAKLKAAAAAGFMGVEIFEPDFVVSTSSARDVRQMCADLGLEIVCYQPFRDFEGLPDPQRRQAFDRAERKFDLMQEMGAELMLICSSIHPLALGGIDRAADDLRALGERLAARGLRAGYEALAWGRHVNDYRDAWEIVRRADHPHIGFILDSFHLFARGLPVDPIRAIPGDRIFLVQIADAPRLHLDALSWSRHFRNFPGQGDLPIAEFMRAVAATGYKGVQSLEIFNDQFRAGSAARIALDGRRSLILLEDQLAASSEGAGQALTDLPERGECRGIEFVEFAMDEGNAATLRSVFAAMGFAKSGLHLSKAVEHWRQGDIHLVINTEETGFAHSHALTHGPGVCAIGLQVEDVATTVERADGLKAQLFRQPVGPGELEIPAIRGVGGSLLYFIEHKGELGEVWKREFRPIDGAVPSAWLASIDHIAQSMPYDEMLSWQLFYTSMFDLDRLEQIDIADPGGLVQSRALLSANGSVRLALNASTAQRTQSSRFLSEFFGAGVQHIALTASDLLGAVEAMRRRGVAFLDIPDNYYADIAARFDLAPEFVARLRANHVLYDRDAAGEFLQIYTKTIAERFFFEIVERRGYGGFGAANAPVRLAAQARAARPEAIPKQ